MSSMDMGKNVIMHCPIFTVSKLDHFYELFGVVMLFEIVIYL